MATPIRRKNIKPVILTERSEEILRAIHFYRFMTALDVAHLLYSPSSLTYVRSLLTALLGGADGLSNQYLFRFPLPRTSPGTAARVFTLGSRGREFLLEVGLPVDWYYRPEKVKHVSFGNLIHHLILTRFLVCARHWCAKQPDFELAKMRISYELANTPSRVTLDGNRAQTVTVIPDAWLLFEEVRGGAHLRWLPILLEIDRGTEYQQRFKQHVRSRLEFICSGCYLEVFGTEAVMLAYVTTGERPDYRETRRKAMCAWAQEVLVEQGRANRAPVFRFCSLVYKDIYATPLFREPVWYRSDQPEPVALFT